jgi:hypothetical protein
MLENIIHTAASANGCEPTLKLLAKGDQIKGAVDGLGFGIDS